MSKNQWKFWILLILLVAAFLRLYAITAYPPGMTHDEADHGLDAWGVVNGIRPLYFTVGYGREPLFDYVTAGLMSFLGPTFLAGRLTSAFFSLVMVAATYSWVAEAFDRRVALLTAAGLAISFWSMMTGRHALRSVTMPSLFMLATAIFWRGRIRQRHSLPVYLAAGVLLGATFYSYMPARILWALFPGLIFLWLLFRPQTCSWQGWPTGFMLLIAAATALPLFYYLQTHPGAEVRLSQLTGPLSAAWNGDFQPIVANLLGSLRTFTFEGDPLWRYNIPGKPFLGPAMGTLFYLGVLLALFRAGELLLRQRYTPRNEATVFSLAWLLLGMVPAFITGPEASVTRVIGMQPILYLFPALALSALFDKSRRLLRPSWRPVMSPVVLLFFVLLLAQSYRDYFIEWGNHPEVRVQYETTLVTAMNYLNQHELGAVSVSNPTPDAFHSPATAMMTLHNPDVDLRWFNGAAALLIPQAATATLIFPGFSQLNQYLQRYFLPKGPAQILPLRPDDIDAPLALYDVDASQQRALWQTTITSLPPVDFEGKVALLGYELQTPTVEPGGQVRLVTRWQSLDAEPDLVLFTHVVQQAGQPPLADANRLDAPSAHWIAGDQFLQLHEMTLPEALLPGEYQLLVGVFRRHNEQRLTIVGSPVAEDNLYRVPQLLIVDRTQAARTDLFKNPYVQPES